MKAFASLLFLLGVANPLVAQQEPDEEPQVTDEAVEAWIREFESSLTYQTGAVVIGGGIATLDVPEAFRFLGPEDARRLLVEGWGNPPMDPPLGVLVPADLSPMSDEGWAVIVTYDEDGYVEDDDAAGLDYGELLSEMQQDTKDANGDRIRAGYDPIELVGWAAPPHYDASEHKIYWAKELAFGESSEHTLNYNIRVLGRRGVLVMNAVAGMSQLESVATDMQSVMGFVAFNDGHRYSDFVPGADKVAAYGIGALVAGKVAAKVGLFKFIVAGLVAAKKLVVVAFLAVAAFFKRLFGRKTGEGAAGTAS